MIGKIGLFLTHTKSQLKIITRYSELLLGGIILYTSIIILFIVLYRSSTFFNLNIPLLATLFTSFLTGTLFGNIFCEKYSEILGYELRPWSLHSIILSKNFALFFLSIIYPLPIFLIFSFFAKSGMQDYINAGLYFITALPVFMLLGNRASISPRALSSSEIVSSTQMIIAVISPIPYIICKVWLNSVVLCASFFCISLIAWYIYELPIMKENFRTVISKMN